MTVMIITVINNTPRLVPIAIQVLFITTFGGLRGCLCFLSEKKIIYQKMSEQR